MNRAPSKNDTWWPRHQATCNGTFEKISEPEKPIKQETSRKKPSSSTSKSSQSSQPSQASNIKKIDNYFTQSAASSLSKPQLSSQSSNITKINNLFTQKPTISPPSKPILVKKDLNIPKIDSFIVKKRKSDEDEVKISSKAEVLCLDEDDKSSLVKPQKLVKQESDDDGDIIFISQSSKQTSQSKKSTDETECPICFRKFSLSLINSHVDSHF
jgi:hypothetical protein